MAAKSQSSTESTADKTQETSQEPANEPSPVKPPLIKPPPQESRLEVISWDRGRQPDVTPTETGDAPTTESQPAGKVMSQADIDAIIANRLEREKAEQKRLAAELDKVSKTLQSYQDAEKTEAEKLAERMAKLEAENQSLMERNRQMAIDQDLGAAASKAQLPIDAALKLADRNAIELDDTGRVTNASELIEAVAKSYPGLVSRQAAPAAPTVNSPRSEQSGKPTDAELRNRFFGSGGGNFWNSGGVLMPTDDS